MIGGFDHNFYVTPDDQFDGYSALSFGHDMIEQATCERFVNRKMHTYDKYEYHLMRSPNKETKGKINIPSQFE